VDVFSPIPVKIIWKPKEVLSFHPNGLLYEAFDKRGQKLDAWRVFSVGGGAYRSESEPQKKNHIYELNTMFDIIKHCETTGQALWEYVLENEGSDLWGFLSEILNVMESSIDRGIMAEGVLPGGLGLGRKAWSFHRKATLSAFNFKKNGLLSAYALAVAEENAAGGIIVTSPTCGSCGVLPAVLRYSRESIHCNRMTLLRALATAGLIGNLVKHNASISGAQVGCQGEIGTACAMAAGAVVQVMGGTIHQIEYAAEMGLEHHLGLTCDPVAGLVQIPCIERNAYAATRAHSCAEYALFTDGFHRISFDQVVAVMNQTGHDLPSLYRETSSGGLAKAFKSIKL
jgi:L-serine dehydratase